jgi:hypothetical protein
MKFYLDWGSWPRNPWIIRCPDGRAARAKGAKHFSHFATADDALRWFARNRKRLEREAAEP